MASRVLQSRTQLLDWLCVPVFRNFRNLMKYCNHFQLLLKLLVCFASTKKISNRKAEVKHYMKF